MSDQNYTDTSSLLKSIIKDFDRPGTESVISIKELASLDELKIYLAEKLAYLLEHKFERLVNTLYLIDIDEEKLSRLFSSGNREYIPLKLAEMIIDRQIQKLHYRKQYKRKLD